MESTLYNISQVLGITILHSLWQGLLIYFMLKIALSFGNRLAATTKYWLAVTSLLAITGWFLVTLFNEISVYNWLAVKSFSLTNLQLMQAIPAGMHQFNQQTIRYYYNIEVYLPYVAALYVIGLIINSGRLILARKKINRIKQGMSIDIDLQHAVHKFTAMLNIAKKVKIGLSQFVDVPCMTGFLKPVILLPFSIATYLSAEEIEAILLHELAHIKRNDYVVNVAQQVISILLFFNPCTLLINRIINEERENCCDDLVVKATADPMIYAKALLKLEQTRQNDWKLALAATGKKYHLLNRIERIMKTKKQIPSLRPTLLATLILTVGIGCIALLKPEIAEGKISVKAIVPIINSMLQVDTAHNAKPAQTAKKVYHATPHKSPSTVTEAENNKKIEDQIALVQKYSAVVSGYYSSPEYQKMQKDIEKLSHNIQAFYDNDDLKKPQEHLEKMGQDFSKNWGESDKQREESEKMGELGREVGDYFSTPEFKKMNQELRKKYGIKDDDWYNGNHYENNDEAHKKYQAELETKLPPEIREKTEKLKQMGDEIGARYKSPEYVEQSKRLQELGDSVNKAYQNPGVLEQQKAIEKLSAKITAYQNSPDVKKAQQDMDRAVKKLMTYLSSTAYQNVMKQLQHLNFNFNFNDDNEKPEKPEKPEAPEKPEKPEGPDNNN